MNPVDLSNSLRRIASRIDKSTNPSKGAVIKDLKFILATVSGSNNDIVEACKSEASRQLGIANTSEVSCNCIVETLPPDNTIYTEFSISLPPGNYGSGNKLIRDFVYSDWYSDLVFKKLGLSKSNYNESRFVPKIVSTGNGFNVRFKPSWSPKSDMNDDHENSDDFWAENLDFPPG